MAYYNKLLNKVINNTKFVFQNIDKELFEYGHIAYKILRYDYLPVALILILTLIMLLPGNIQDMLRFHWGNPSWWQYITQAFVHQNSSHFVGNVSMLVFIMFLQLLLVHKMGEEKRYHWLLFISLFAVPIATLLVQSYYGAYSLPFYRLGSTSCGISGVITAIISFSPFIILTYYSKIIGKNLINFSILLVVSAYALLAFQISACLIVPTSSMFLFMVILLLAFIGACFIAYYKQAQVWKKTAYLALNDYIGSKMLTTIIIVVILLLFLIMPLLLLSNNLVVDGAFVDFIAHFLGILVGLVLGYWMFASVTHKTN